MPDIIITPSTGKLEFIDNSAQNIRKHAFSMDDDGLSLDAPLAATSIKAPLNIINVNVDNSNTNYPFVLASGSAVTGTKTLMMDGAGGTYNPFTNTATIDISGNSATTTLASNSSQLNGQAASYYTDINARLGYTPVNKAGDTVTGNLIINGNFSVNGSFTAFSASNVYISSSQLYIEDNILTLNAFSPYLRYAGVEMYDSGSGTLSSLLWDGESDYFFLTGSSVNGKIITGPDGQTNLTANYIPKATAGYKLGNSLIYDDGTNVGIGTTVPSTKFHVVGNAEVGDSTADTGLIVRHGSGTAQYGRIRFYSTSTNINTIHSFPTAWNSGTFLNASAGALNLGGTNGVTFGSWNNVDVAFAQGGNNYFKNSVGIGTTVPASLLHVYSTSAEPAIRLTSTSGSAKTYGLVCNTPWAPGSLHIYDYTADASRIHISSNGNVGIGVGGASPVQKFQVEGLVGNPATTAATQNGIIRISNTTDNAVFDFGIRAGGTGAWLQSTDKTSLAVNYPLLLNPNGGNVGIGTSSPSYKLQVNGGPTEVAGQVVASFEKQSATDGKIATFINTTGSGYTSYIYIGSNPGRDWKIGKNVLNSGTTGHFQITNDLNQLRMQISAADDSITFPSSSVGVGTTTPGVKLDVYQTTNDAVIRSKTTAAGAYVHLDTGVDGYYGINLLNAGTSKWFVGGYGTTSFTITKGIGVNEYFRIDTNGNVGIGTTSPGGKLDIVTSGANLTTYDFGWDLKVATVGSWARSHRIYNTNYTAGTSFFGVLGGGSSVSYAYWTYGNPASIDATGYNTSNGIFLIPSGNVGIGTTVPGGKLEIRTDATSNYIFSGSSTSGYTTTFTMDDTASYFGHDSSVRSLILRTNSTARLTVKGDGNVGIGITVPTAPLHVVGVISGSSFTGAGTGLTGTAAGLSIGGNAATSTTASYSLNTTLTTAATYPITSSWATNAVTALNGGVTSISAGTGIGTSAGTGAVTITNSSPNATHTGEVTGATTLTISSSAITTVKIADANVTNAKLANSSLTIGSTAVSLGGTVTTFAGLASVTSTAFVGALTGNVTGNVTGTAGSETFATVTGRGASTTTQISVGTTAGGSMYTGIKSGAGYSDAVSGATFKSITDHPTGGSYAFAAYFNGAPGTGTNSFFVAADGTGYFKGNVGIGTTAPQYPLDISGSNIRSFSTAGGAEPGFIADYPSSNGYGGFFIHVNNTRRWRIGSVGDTNVQPALNFWQEGTGSRMIITNTGNVGIGTTSPAARLQLGTLASVSTATTETISLGGTFSNSAGSNIKLKVYDDATSIGGMSVSNGQMEVTTWSTGKIAFYRGTTQSAIIDINGNLGIGVSSPSQLLHVYKGNTGGLGGAIMIDNNGLAAANETALMFGDGGASNIRAAISSTTENSPYYGDIKFKTGQSVYSSLTTRMIIKGDGNVGIGTSSPANKLHVYGTGGGFEFGVGSSNCYIETIDRASTGKDLNTVYYTRGSGSFSWNNGSYTERMKIDGSGNVGIGSTSPLSTLNLSGGGPTILTLGTTSYPSTYLTTLGVDSSARGFLILGNNGENQIRAGRTTTGGYIDFYTNNTVAQTTLASDGNFVMRLAASGNVGIGTTNPIFKFQVVGSAYVNNGTLYIDSGNSLTWGNSTQSILGTNDVGLSFTAGSATRMFVSSSGNVGIGTTTPGAKFVVNGGTVNTTTYTTSESRIADGSIHLMKTVAGGIFESIRAMNVDTTAGTTVRVLAAATSDPFNNANGGKVFIDAIRTSTNMDLAFSLNDVAAAAPVERVRFMGSGNVGIGTTAPGYKLQVNGDIYANGGYLRVGGNNGLYFESYGGGWFMSDSTWVRTHASKNVWTGVGLLGSDGGLTVGYGGNSPTSLGAIISGSVGIGTNTPILKLVVKGESSYPATTGTTQTGVFRLTGGTGLYNVLDMGVNESTDTAWIQATRANSLSTYDKLLINPYGGNVGIGTTAPGALLNVNGRFMAGGTTSDVTTAHILMNTTGVAIQYTGNTGNYLMISPGDANTTISLKADARTGAYPPMDFWTSNTSRITILANGFVGIGTTAPASKFEVFGGDMSLKMTGVTTGSILFKNSSGTKIQEIRYDDSDGSMTLGGVGGYPIKFITSTTEKVRISGTGNVGIGTTSPAALLHVDTAGADARIRVSAGTNTVQGGMIANTNGLVYAGSITNHGFSLRTNDTDRVRIQTDGNVGIGITSPTVKLTVSADVTDADVGQLRLVGSTSSAKMLSLGYQTTSNYGFISALIAGTGYSNLSLQPNGGNVGIGTTTGTFTLNVYNNADVWHARFGSATGEVRIGGQTSSGAVIQAFVPGSGAVRDLYLQRDGGSVGIGTAAPNDKLDVVGRVYAYRYIAVSSNASLPAYATDTNTGMFNAATNQIGFSISSAEKVRIDTNGNVGIGTTVPGKKLDVEGVVRTRGATGTGGFEIGAATTGTAKWRIEWDSASDSLDFNWVG